ncbi:hypothetical protein GMSM_03550 [Geomonas sp. Red276]
MISSAAMFQTAAPMPMAPATGNLPATPAPAGGNFAGVLQGAQASVNAQSSAPAAATTANDTGAAPEGASSARSAAGGQAAATAKPVITAGGNPLQVAVVESEEGETAAASSAPQEKGPAASPQDGQHGEVETDDERQSADSRSTGQSPLWSFAPSLLAMAGAMAAQGNGQPEVAVNRQETAKEAQPASATNQLQPNAGELQPNANQHQPNAGELQLNPGQLQLNVSQLPLNAGQLPLNVGQLPLNAGQLQPDVSQLPLNAGQLPLNAGQLQLNAGQLQLNAGQLQPNAGQLQPNASQPNLAQDQTPAIPAQPIPVAASQEAATAPTFQATGIANAAAAPAQGADEGQVKVKQQQPAELDGMTVAGADQKGAQADHDSVGGVEGDRRQPAAQAGATTQNGGTQPASTPVATNQANTPSPSPASAAHPATVPAPADTSAAAPNPAPAQAATPASDPQGQNVNASAAQPTPVTTVAAQTATPVQGAATAEDPMAPFAQGQAADSRQDEGTAGTNDRRATATDGHVRSLFAEKPAGQPAQATTVATSETTGTKPAVLTQAGSQGVPQGAAEQKASGDGHNQSGFQKEQYRPQDQFFNAGLNAQQNQPAAQPAPAESSAHLKSLEQSIMAQVKDGVVTHDAKGNSQITVRLNPDELGELKIQVKMVDNTVKVEVQADNKMVKDLLMGNLDNLKQALAGKNFTMEGFNVSTGNGGFNGSLADQGNSQQQSTPRFLRSAGYADAAPSKVNYVTEETDNLVSVRL